MDSLVCCKCHKSLPRDERAIIQAVMADLKSEGIVLKLQDFTCQDCEEDNGNTVGVLIGAGESEISDADW